MKKTVYKHPEFVIQTADKRIENENKRLWLSLTIDNERNKSIVVILKNPSKATKDISDKTVYTVVSYIYKNRDNFKQFQNIGKVIILNLIPFYETYSDQLIKSNFNLADIENLKTIKDITSKHTNVIVAWGDHPKGLKKVYEEIKLSVFTILNVNKNDMYYVDKLSKSGNPKHGQVWSYKDPLKQYNSF